MKVFYLPTLVANLPVDFVFQPDGALRENVSRLVAMKVVRVIAGAKKCHVVINIKRPYYFPTPTKMEGE